MAKLLIVDDEADVREFAANFFRKRKVEVVTAADGQKAVALAQKEKPRLILLDIKMPDMDGIATLEEIRKIDNAVKVIMVTGRDPQEEGSFKRCQELGAIDYIHKPLKLEELERVVLRALR